MTPEWHSAEVRLIRRDKPLADAGTVRPPGQPLRGCEETPTEEMPGVVGWRQGARSGPTAEPSRVAERAQTEGNAGDADETWQIRPSGFFHKLSARHARSMSLAIGLWGFPDHDFELG